ncbi:MAG TPA: hypothetical protein VNK43_07015 [Gemmatimonadales bacterium]|nr:hypothetical protein [Gemmatimonadales bacterium]
MKIQRQAAILRIVRDRRIESQDELRGALLKEGFDVTQATLSRDLRQLGLSKIAGPDGRAYYASPRDGEVRPGLGAVLPALLVGLEGVGPLLVLKTAEGAAGAVGAALDEARWEDVVGTVSGENTVLVIARSSRGRRAIARRLEELTRRAGGPARSPR